MNKIAQAIGPAMVLSLLGMILKPILPWLKEQAAKTETPLDNWTVEFLELIFGVKGEG